MRKKGIIVWVNYLMYTFFTIVVLSIVLYAALDWINYNKVKIILSENEKLILLLDKKVKDAYNCYECEFKADIYVPEMSSLSLKNGWINSTIVINRKYFYNYTSDKVVVSWKRVKNIVVYNFSKKSEYFVSDQSLWKISTGEYCISFNKTKAGLIVTFCK